MFQYNFKLSMKLNDWELVKVKFVLSEVSLSDRSIEGGKSLGCRRERKELPTFADILYVDRLYKHSPRPHGVVFFCLLLMFSKILISNNIIIKIKIKIVTLNPAAKNRA